MRLEGPSTFDLARLIEGANAQALELHSQAAAQLFPELGATALHIGGGVAAFIGKDIPISYAVGLGLDGPVTSDDIAQIAEFYRTREMAPRVDVCPQAHASLLGALRERGFQLHWFMNVLVRPLRRDEMIEPLPEGITVRQAEPDEAELWTRTVDEGFAEGGPLTEARRQLGLILFHRPKLYAYFAEIDGEIAGGGALFTHDRLAALSASSTRLKFRNRGVHAALIRARLRKAQELGCDTVDIFASPGSVSERNALRHGLRLAYTKATMKAELIA